MTKTSTSTTALAIESLGPKYCTANVAQNFGGFAMCETTGLHCTHYAFTSSSVLTPINSNAFYYARNFISFNLVHGQFHAAPSEHTELSQSGILYMPDRIRGGAVMYKNDMEKSEGDYALQCRYNYDTYATTCYNAEGQKLAWWTSDERDLGLGLTIPEGKRSVGIRIW